MIQLLIICLATIVIYMTLWFILSKIIGKNDIVDIAWGLGFVVVCLVCILLTDHPTLRMWILSILTFIWGARLALHIFLRGRGKPEDRRYVAMGKKWGKRWPVVAYFQIFLLQGVLLTIVSLPTITTFAFDQPDKLQWLIIPGIILWIVGFLFESIGDYQLGKFVKHKKKGEIMKTGLWKYTRHPNYFGEVTMWWAIFIISYSTPISLIGMIGPLLITWLILQVSGIPMMEEKYQDNPEFQKYKAKTNAFFPWWPKNS